MKLYAIFVGGNHPQAMIEVHDVRFVIAASLEAAIPALRSAWWGSPQSLHIDAYAELTAADGFAIEVHEGVPATTGGRRLWFVNTGGYDPDQFGELHAYSFLVGQTKADIWSRARQAAPRWSERHKDNLCPVDDVIDISAAATTPTHHVVVGRPLAGGAPRIVSSYLRL